MVSVSGGGGGGTASGLFDYLLEQRDRPGAPKIMSGGRWVTESLVESLHEQGREQTFQHFSLAFVKKKPMSSFKSVLILLRKPFLPGWRRINTSRSGSSTQKKIRGFTFI